MNTHRPLRAAFYGRTACGVDPTHAAMVLDRQYQQCRTAFPDGALVAVFFDVGSPGRYGTAPATLGSGERHVHRHGGLDDLLAEATRPSRRFNAVIAFGADRLSRNTAQATAIVRHLTASGVAFLAADSQPADAWGHPLLMPPPAFDLDVDGHLRLGPRGVLR